MSRCSAVPIETSAIAERFAEFPTWSDNESFVAFARVVVVALSVGAHEGACGDAVSSEIPDVIGEAHASVRSRAKAVHTFVLADGITLPEVVHVSLVTLAAYLNQRHRRIRLAGESAKEN